jgi:phosphoglycolate phosphatase
VQAVGFDLDMTLVDSRPQILAAFGALAAETGAAIDLGAVEARLGLKLERELEHWFDLVGIDDAAAVFRRHYVELAAQTTLLPGAHEALAAVRAVGATPVIVTAKHRITAQPCLDAVQLGVEKVFCFVHGTEKAAVLRDVGAALYVGDTPADMEAAAQARIPALGVATGSFTADDLTNAGATAILATLEDFPAWFRSFAEGAA